MIAFAFTALLLLSGIAAAEATQGEAQAALNAANEAIGAAIAADKDITAADAKYAQAFDKFRSGEYDAAITLANEAKALAESAPPKAGSQAGNPGTNTTNSTQGTPQGQAGTGGTNGNGANGTSGSTQGSGQDAGASETTPVQQGTPEPASTGGPNWLLIAIVFGAAGFGTIVFLGLAWFFFLRKRY